MIAHVAEAGENRGRIVLQLRSATPSRIALEAAILLAHAFNAEIEGVFVEDVQLIDLARFPFARETGHGGTRALGLADIEQELRYASAAIFPLVEGMARAAGIPVHCRVMRDDPVMALATACAERGPWNLVALADPFAPVDGQAVGRLLETALQATGVLMVGPKARRTQGPIVIALEEADRLPGMLHVAERLAGTSEEPIVVLIVTEATASARILEEHCRLLMGERTDVTITVAEASRGEPAVAAETLRQMRPGFVVAQYGLSVMPSVADLTPLAAALECPLLLVR